MMWEVEFTTIVRVEAENETEAYEKAEPIARKNARVGAWSNYDECVTRVEES